MPLAGVLRRLSTDADRQDVIARETLLFYVACTRARGRLIVTGAGPLTEFAARVGAA